LDGQIAQLSTRFGDMEEARLLEALRPLQELLPAPDNEVSMDALGSRCESVAARAQQVERLLEDMSEAGKLVRLSIATVAPDPIASEDELEVILGRLRDAVQSLLAEEKKVKLS
jgi:hypothetical protein